VADQIFKSHILRSQQQHNLEMIANKKGAGSQQAGPQSVLSALLMEELGRTDYLVYVDEALELTDEER